MAIVVLLVVEIRTHKNLCGTMTKSYNVDPCFSLVMCEYDKVYLSLSMKRMVGGDCVILCCEKYR